MSTVPSTMLRMWYVRKQLQQKKVILSIGRFKIMTSGARAEIMHRDVRPLARSKNPTPFVLQCRAVQAAEVSWAGNKTCYLQG